MQTVYLSKIRDITRICNAFTRKVTEKEKKVKHPLDFQLLSEYYETYRIKC